MKDEHEADSYETISDTDEMETKVKGSRFLPQGFGITDPDDVPARLDLIRKRHHAATHHCWAYVHGLGQQRRERFNDDGEPSGSAGAPILAAINGSGLCDLLVVVTRYFGGTKLGRGGLVRAYGEAAALALAAAPRRTVWRDRILNIRCDYGDVGAVEAIVSSRGEEISAIDRDFSEHPSFQLRVRRSRFQDLRDAIVEATCGRCTTQES